MKKTSRLRKYCVVEVLKSLRRLLTWLTQNKLPMHSLKRWSKREIFTASWRMPEMRLTHEHDDEYFSHIAGINQLGVFHTLREAAKHMITRSEAGRPGGSLVGMSSLSGFLGYPGLAAYASAKGAMEALIRVMVVEYGAYGIRA